MSLSTKKTLKQILDRATLSEVLDALRGTGAPAGQQTGIAFGTFVRNMHVALRCVNPGLAANSPYDLATLAAIVLPDDAKALKIARAYGRLAGSATSGELSVQAYGATPTGGQIAVSPAGNIVVLATDLWTNIDIEYEPEKMDVVELTLPVVAGTGVCVLPITTDPRLGGGLPAQPATPSTAAIATTMVTGGAVVRLMEAEVLTGGVTGKFIVIAEATAAPGTTKQASLDLPKANVRFKVSDAVTSCRVKLGVACRSQFSGQGTPDVDALLNAELGSLLP